LAMVAGRSYTVAYLAFTAGCGTVANISTISYRVGVRRRLEGFAGWPTAFLLCSNLNVYVKELPGQY
jgi:hypothetical protein